MEFGIKTVAIGPGHVLLGRKLGFLCPLVRTKEIDVDWVLVSPSRDIRTVISKPILKKLPGMNEPCGIELWRKIKLFRNVQRADVAHDARAMEEAKKVADRRRENRM